MTYVYPDFICQDGTRPTPYGVGSFFAETDLAFAAPLQIFDAADAPLGTTMTADQFGYVRAVRLVPLSAVWKSGPNPPQPMQSFTGLRTLVEQAEASAARSSNLVGAPADAAIETAIKGVGTLTKKALDAGYASKPAGLAGSWASSAARAQNLAAIVRPTKYAATYYVNADGSGTHTTIKAATDAAVALQAKGGTLWVANDVYRSPDHPDRTVRIVIAAGTYLEQMQLVPFVHFVGATGDPRDVIVQSALQKGAASGGYGCMVEHITMDGSSGVWYAMHLQSGVVSAFHNCRFIAAGGEILGMDGYPDSLILFLGCTFTVTGATSIKANVHGAAANKLPLTIVFVDCTHPSGIAYSDLTSGQADVLHVIGGSVGPVELNGAKVIGHIDSTAVTTVTLLNGAKAQYGKTPPPVPAGFLRRQDREHFYPLSPAKSSYKPIVESDMATGSLTAARTYFIPMRISEYRKMHWINVAVTTALGTATPGLAADDGTGKPGVMVASAGPLALAVGKNALYVAFPMHLFPGDVVWAALQVSDATAVLSTSTLLSTLTECFYQDGAMPARGAASTPVALPVGTRVPALNMT